MKRRCKNIEFRALIKNEMYLRNISRGEMATCLRISTATYDRKMNKPDNFMAWQLAVFSKKLHIEMNVLLKVLGVM